MATVSAPAAPWSAAHRRVVLEHISATLAPCALACAIAAPLIGVTLIWGSTFVAMLCQLVTTGGEGAGALLGGVWETLFAAYAAAALPSAIAGVWLALLSPFTLEDPRFHAGAGAIGLVTGLLFVSTDEAAGMFGGQLFLGLVGAVSVFLCGWLFRNIVLKRDEIRRDQLARERATRLAQARSARD